MNTGSLLGLLAVLLLVAANGFFVAAEFALVKVRKSRIDQLVAEGQRTAGVVQTELAHLSNFIAATQLGITLASLALGWVGEPAVARLVAPVLVTVAGEQAAGFADSVAIALSFTLITAFHIILGEFVPKSVALQRSERVALFVARPLYIFSRIFRPFILLMSAVGGRVVRVLGLQAVIEHTSVHTVEELEMLVTQSREAGVLDNKEEILLRRVFDFNDKTANQVMTPRTEIVGVSKDVDWDALVEQVMGEHYTRFPVYDNTLDDIVGVVHVKDLFGWRRTAPPGTRFVVELILRPVLKVPESVSLGNLLTQMQSRKIHLTVLIDEYGGTAGIVTMEDILEEIVGEVQDEFDTRAKDIHHEVEVLPDGSSSVDGLMKLGDFAERFGVAFEETDYETIAGYVFGLLGRGPKVGDAVAIGDYRLRVLEMDNLRIARLHVERVAPPSPTEVAVAADATGFVDRSAQSARKTSRA